MLGAVLLLAGPARIEPLDVHLAHPVRELESLGVDRGDRGERRRGGDPVGQERRRREHVRPAARDAPGAEPLDPEGIADRGDIGGAVCDRAPGVAGRAAVSRTVVGDEPDPSLGGIADMRLVEQARRRRSVVDQHRHAARVAAFPHRQRAPVRPVDRARRGPSERSL